MSQFEREPYYREYGPNESALEDRAVEIFETTDPDKTILKAEMALELSAHDLTLSDGSDPMDYIYSHPMEILSRADAYPRGQREWMMRRAEAVIEAAGERLHDKGETGVRFLRKFASVEGGVSDVRTDAALMVAVGALDVARGQDMKDMLLDRLIPTYFVDSARSDTKKYALARLVEEGVNLDAYFERVAPTMQHYRGNKSRFPRGEQWHQDHLAALAAGAYIANGRWLEANNFVSRIDNYRLQGNVLVDMWMAMDTEKHEDPHHGSEGNTPAYRRFVREEISKLRDKMQYPPIEAPEEYEVGWRELTLGLARMHLKTGENAVARIHLNEVLDAGAIDKVPVGKALARLYASSGNVDDRTAAVNFMYDNFDKPQTVVDIATQIAEADVRHGRTLAPAAKGMVHTPDHRHYEVYDEGAIGLPYMYRDIGRIIERTGMEEVYIPETLAQLHSHAASLMAESGGTMVSLWHQTLQHQFAAPGRSGEVRSLLTYAKAANLQRRDDLVELGEIQASLDRENEQEGRAREIITDSDIVAHFIDTAVEVGPLADSDY